MNHISDDLIDSIIAEPLPVQRYGRSLGRLTGPRQASVAVSVFDVFGWSDLLYLAGGVRDRMGIGQDDSGFRYPGDELNPGEEPFKDVHVYNPVEEASVGVEAFERLAARYFRTLVEGVAGLDDPVSREAWWPEFVAATEEIERRVASQGGPMPSPVAT